MALKTGDFIEVEYTGQTAEDGIIFDTTDEKTAKENGLANQRSKFGAVTVVLGEKHLIKGIDEQLEGKELNKKYTFEVSAEKAFGKRNAKLLQLIPLSRFKKEKIRPMPGMQVNVDNQLGVIRSISGGRTIVDFNHPLAGKDVKYDVEVKGVVNDLQKKVDTVLDMSLGQLRQAFKAVAREGKAVIEMQLPFPEEMQTKMTEELKRLIPDLKDVKYAQKAKKEEKKQ